MPFMKDEIKRAVWDQCTLKSPGPDSFLLLFYNVLCDEIRGNVLKLLVNMTNRTTILYMISYSLVTLIPKKESPERVEDYRAIALINRHP